ncbi:hypothetical protein RND71_009551 [Anisodus tanguticus]|uniref:Protein kinase domain-containing protein n=1 Tax=Anisodus tanguticus TaxID=243964 RepID=A0AAE1VN10_9SOLA|nr:hypothetical protein RND71_009551 [Anisodus tanguticus]
MNVQFGTKDFQEKVSGCLRPWQRSFQFWVRAVDIYTAYKVYDRCSSTWVPVWMDALRFRVAQLIGKPDLAPAAWVRRLVTLCDQAPAMPYNVIRAVLEKELDQNIDELFERFDVDPLGSASIAQVHRARLKGDKTDVVVKVQHPGVQELMMADIHNLQAFALYLQKMDITFDLYSLTKEIEKQLRLLYSAKKELGLLYSANARLKKITYWIRIQLLREADAMDRIRRFLYQNNKKSPVMVPRVIRDIVTRRVLVMEYIDGTPILKLGDEMAKRGMSPEGKVAAIARHIMLSPLRNILKSLSLAYGQMILRSGFFHADPHPGNILICRGAEASMNLFFFFFQSQVALLDYGQVKDLTENLRLGYANLVLSIADGDATRATESFNSTNDKAFPEELFSVLRTLQLLRGLSVGLGISHSCAEQWRHIAEEALYSAAPDDSEEDDDIAIDVEKIATKLLS